MFKIADGGVVMEGYEMTTGGMAQG